VNVWQRFSLGEYDLYLKIDDCCWLIYWRLFGIVATSYELDPAFYYTLPSFIWDAMLKHTRVNFELLTDVNMVLFIKCDICVWVNVQTGMHRPTSTCSRMIHWSSSNTVVIIRRFASLYDTIPSPHYNSWWSTQSRSARSIGSCQKFPWHGIRKNIMRKNSPRFSIASSFTINFLLTMNPCRFTNVDTNMLSRRLWSIAAYRRFYTVGDALR